MTTNPQTNSINQAEGGSKPSQKLYASGSEHRAKHKGGRPPKAKETQMSCCVKVYFSPSTHKRLKLKAKREERTLSEICREYVENGYTVSPISQEQTSYIRKLAGMSTNLNQLAHESHIQFTEDLAKRVETLAKQIEEVLVWFSDKVTHG